MAGPGDEIAAARGQSGDDLRASHADREHVIGAVKVAFVQGRLTEDELDARVGQVYASRTYAELVEVTVDIPIELTRAGPPRDPWRATKVSWAVVYALVLPGLCTLVAYSGSPAPASVGDALTRFAVVYAIFWILGVSVMVASRHRKRSGGQPPPRSAPGVNEMAADAGGCDRLLVCRAQVTRTLQAALVHGRLTEDEYDERAGQASASRSRAELAELTADLPVGPMDSPARPPAARDVWIGVSVSIAAASVVTAVCSGTPVKGR